VILKSKKIINYRTLQKGSQVKHLVNTVVQKGSQVKYLVNTIVQKDSQVKHWLTLLCRRVLK